jgi:hypothetical protein
MYLVRVLKQISEKYATFLYVDQSFCRKWVNFPDIQNPSRDQRVTSEFPASIFQHGHRKCILGTLLINIKLKAKRGFIACPCLGTTTSSHLLPKFIFQRYSGIQTSALLPLLPALSRSAMWLLLIVRNWKWQGWGSLRYHDKHVGNSYVRLRNRW